MIGSEINSLYAPAHARVMGYYRCYIASQLAGR
jgi:hypothetical protein